MVKATLRTNPAPKVAPKTIDVDATVVSEKVESTVGAATATGNVDLTTLVNDEPQERETSSDAPPVNAGGSVPHNRAVSKYAPAAVEGFDGDWGADDVKFPQLKLVQGSGPLSQQFDAGSVIFGQELLFAPASVVAGAAKPVLKFVPIAIPKQWREKLSQDQAGDGLTPRIVNSIKEVEELGGTTRWVGNQMPDNLWEPSARCILLIEAPENTDHPGFALELDGKLYAVAVYYAAGGAFRASAKVIFNTAMTSLLVRILDAEGKPVIKNGRPLKRPLIYKNFWNLTFEKVQAGNFTPWRPAVKLLCKEECGPDIRAFCEGLTKSAEQVEAAAAPAE
jgi:hypothetical protein